MKTKLIFTLIALMMLAGTAGAASIFANSSDLMFTANSTDTVNFTSNLTGIISWAINKTNNSYQTTDNLNWTVPSNNDTIKQIYEITAHNDTMYIEWVVTTLSLSNAPNIFDSFSDKKYSTRTELDMWNRSLPEWTVRDGTYSTINASLNGTSTINYINTSSNIIYGTWVIQFKFNGSTDEAFDFFPIANNSWDGTDYQQNSYRFIRTSYDEHMWLDFLNITSVRYPVGYELPSMVGMNYFNANSSWHTLRLIHDTDGSWYIWYDDVYVPFSYKYHDLEDISTEIAIYLYGTVPTISDNVMVWNRSIFPYRNAVYNSTSDDIEISGWNNTLSSVAAEINNVSIIDYNSSSNITAYKNISVMWGANLTIQNETLIFRNQTTSKLVLRKYAGSHLNIINSSIDSKNNYVKWRSANSIGTLPDTYYTGSSITVPAGKLRIVNSTLINFSALGIQNERRMILNNITIRNIEYNTNSIYTVYSYADEVEILDTDFGTSTASLKGTINPRNLFGNQIVNQILRDITGSWLYRNTEGTNIDTSQNPVLGYSATEKLYLYYYVDINVTDSNGNPIDGAEITFNRTANNLNPNIKTWQITTSGQIGNIYDNLTKNNTLIKTYTGADGHSPLPSNKSYTIVLLASEVNNTATNKTYAYQINVSKTGYPVNSSVIIISDSTWYRSNPSTYQNSTHVILSSTDIPPTTPGIPININSTHGIYWINTTWEAAGGVITDSYNVSVNGTWYNGTLNPFYNNTGLANFAYSNVTVWAWNNTGNGNLSTSSINLSTQLVLYSISGYATDNYGYVVSGATVTSSGGSNTTNATGYYIIPEQLDGTYSLSFSKTGYATGTLSVTVSGTNVTNQNIVLTITNAQSAYKTSTCRSTLQWGEVGSALLIVLILLTAGGLALGFMSGKLSMDTFPIQEFVITLVAVVVIGSIGVAIINPIIIVVGCP